MKLYLSEKYFIDTTSPIDLSIPLDFQKNTSAWNLEKPSFNVVKDGSFIGSVADGGNVNFRDISFNPHSHCTHTECCGHITKKIHSINQQQIAFFCKALLISATPKKRANTKADTEDFVIDLDSLKDVEQTINDHEAIIIRSIPNTKEKLNKNYSGTNPCYLDCDIIPFLNKHAIKHLIIDLPSVDKENDGGELAFHHKFWNVPSNPDLERTITELAYIPENINDGEYVLNLQIAPFENDASPSRPILFKVRRAV